MRKIVLCVLAFATIFAFGSCTFVGTATLALKDSSDSMHTITSVTFYPTDGGTMDSRSVNIEPGEQDYIYRVEPGTYDITVTFEGYGGDITVENDQVIEEGMVYLRTVEVK